MTNISKKLLKDDVKEKLVDQLASFFANQNQVRVNNLFLDLFTSVEQVMLVKRLAIIIMVHEKYTNYQIAKYLMVSDSTVRNLRSEVNLGQHDYLINHFLNKKFNAKAFWQTVEIILRAGLPSRGNDRWKALDKLK